MRDSHVRVALFLFSGQKIEIAFQTILSILPAQLRARRDDERLVRGENSTIRSRAQTQMQKRTPNGATSRARSSTGERRIV